MNIQERLLRKALTDEEKAQRAEKYGKSVLKAMKKDPGNCKLFNEIVRDMNNNAYLALSERFIYYAKGIRSIHLRKCTQGTAHSILSR